LKSDPNLAYLFSKIGAAWTNANPPTNPQVIDDFIVQEFKRHGKNPQPANGAGSGIFLTIK